jgi:hypothetical protein
MVYSPISLSLPSPACHEKVVLTIPRFVEREIGTSEEIYLNLGN